VAPPLCAILVSTPSVPNLILNATFPTERHPQHDVRYPNPQNPKQCVAEFRKKAARFRLPFYLVCDFESFLCPIHNNNDDVDAVKATNIIDEHQVCGFACHSQSIPEYQTDPVVYSGPNVIDKFYERNE